MVCMADSAAPLVGVIMGSDSDYSLMADAVQVLREFGIAHEVEVVSAHDEPDRAHARMRWRHYTQQGYGLVRHDLVQKAD